MTLTWALTLYLGSILLNMGAFFNMSGMITNLHPKDASLRCVTQLLKMVIGIILQLQLTRKAHQGGLT